MYSKYFLVLGFFALGWMEALGQSNTFPSSGNTGIGTTSPSQPLEVAGQIMANVAGGGSLSLKGINANSQPLIYFERNAGAVWLAGLTSDANASFFFNNGYGGGNVMTLSPDGKVGIGTANPLFSLDIHGFGTRIINGNGNAAQLNLFQTNGGRDWALVSWGSAAGGGSLSNKFSIYDNTVGTHRLTLDGAGNVGIGTTAPSHKLAVNGAVRAKEVIVDSGWSDYVFAADYRLAPLSEVEAHIRAKKHLPGIPSAAEVEAQGVSVGEMQSKLLAKIEELTLHLISQEKRLSQIEAENVALRARP